MRNSSRRLDTGRKLHPSWEVANFRRKLSSVTTIFETLWFRPSQFHAHIWCDVLTPNMQPICHAINFLLNLYLAPPPVLMPDLTIDLANDLTTWCITSSVLSGRMSTSPISMRPSLEDGCAASLESAPYQLPPRWFDRIISAFIWLLIIDLIRALNRAFFRECAEHSEELVRRLVYLVWGRKQCRDRWRWGRCIRLPCRDHRRGESQGRGAQTSCCGSCEETCGR